jgi:hypothetical protein
MAVPSAQIGRMMSGAEAARVIGRLVEARGKPEEMTGRFPRPWRVVENPASLTVQDARGQNVAWFYFDNDPGIAQAAAVRFKRCAAESYELHKARAGVGRKPTRCMRAALLRRNGPYPVAFACRSRGCMGYRPTNVRGCAAVGE